MGIGRIKISGSGKNLGKAFIILGAALYGSASVPRNVAMAVRGEVMEMWLNQMSYEESGVAPFEDQYEQVERMHRFADRQMTYSHIMTSFGISGIVVGLYGLLSSPMPSAQGENRRKI